MALGGWMDGWQSQVKDCLQQSKLSPHPLTVKKFEDVHGCEQYSLVQSGEKIDKACLIFTLVKNILIIAWA